MIYFEEKLHSKFSYHCTYNNNNTKQRDYTHHWYGVVGTDDVYRKMLLIRPQLHRPTVVDHATAWRNFNRPRTRDVAHGPRQAYTPTAQIIPIYIIYRRIMYLLQITSSVVLIISNNDFPQTEFIKKIYYFNAICCIYAHCSWSYL